ncbi:MAG: SdrD B-like domain-containing protein [Lachnospiraceae bacterium]
MGNMSKARKRLCSLLLILVMVIVMLPVSLSAEEGEEQTEEQVTSEIESDSEISTESESEAVAQGESELSEPTETTQSEESEFQGGSISGLLWYDENYDGIHDDGETGIMSYPVYLYKADDTDNAVQTVATDENGEYSFTDIESGIYVVGVKSNELGTDYYLLPVAGVTGDNKLGTWSDGWDEKYSDAVTIDTNSTVSNINGGMRKPPGIQPMATYTINMGTVSAGGTGYTYASNTVTFTTAAASHTYTISGTTTTKTIVIPSGVTVNLTLSGVNIQTATSPIQLLGTAVANITLSGTNTLKCTVTGSFYGCQAGLHVDPSAILNVDGTTSDTLNVKGGGGGSTLGCGGGAGIGGSFSTDYAPFTANGSGTIKITGGTVVATGGGTTFGAAGIGGAYAGSGGVITISGTADVTATGGGTAVDYRMGAGIGGGGHSGNGGTITISGGTVTATGIGSIAMDIGYGGGSSGTIVITGGSVLPTRGASYVYNPTNGTVNGNDTVSMYTFSSLASSSFSFLTAGSASVYTYSGVGHSAAGHLWLPPVGLTTDTATSVITTPAVVTAPNTVNSTASSVATLNGTFYLTNTYSVTSAYFQWGTTTGYGNTETVADSSGSIATGTHTRYVNLTGLQLGTTYHYRFVIVTNGSTRYGDDITFTTPAVVPSVDVTHSSVTNTTVTLSGIYALNGGTFTSGVFEISTDGGSTWITLTSSSTPAVSSGTGVTVSTGQLNNSTTTPSVNLTGLSAGTTYQYRFTVTNSVGSNSEIGTFTAPYAVTEKYVDDANTPIATDTTVTFSATPFNYSFSGSTAPITTGGYYRYKGYKFDSYTAGDTLDGTSPSIPSATLTGNRTVYLVYENLNNMINVTVPSSFYWYADATTETSTPGVYAIESGSYSIINNSTELNLTVELNAYAYTPFGATFSSVSTSDITLNLTEDLNETPIGSNLLNGASPTGTYTNILYGTNYMGGIISPGDKGTWKFGFDGTYTGSLPSSGELADFTVGLTFSVDSTTP